MNDDDFDFDPFDMDYMSDDGPEFRAGVKQYEHVGLPGEGGTIIEGDSDTARAARFQEKQDPILNFKKEMAAIARDLSGCPGGFNDDTVQNDIEEMKKMVNSVRNIQYLNPTGFVLGYIASSAGTRMDASVVKSTFKLLKYVQDTSVKSSDVVRYARYWSMVLS